MVRRLSLLFAFGLLVAGIAVAPAMAAACSSSLEGSILLPVPTSIPPPFNTDDAKPAHLILMFQLFNLDRGADFWLFGAHGNEPVGPCVQANCIYAPDFNVAFFKDDGDEFHTQVGPTSNDAGPDHGMVPVEADYALIWMRTGVDAVGVGPGAASGEFIFAQGCSATPWAL